MAKRKVTSRRRAARKSPASKAKATRKPTTKKRTTTKKRVTPKAKAGRKSTTKKRTTTKKTVTPKAKATRKSTTKKRTTTRKTATPRAARKPARRVARRRKPVRHKVEFDFNAWLLPRLELEKYELHAEPETGVRDKIKGSTRYAWIGAGQCGGRIVQSFYDLGYRKVLAVNTTHHDLDLLDIPKEQKFLMDLGAKGAGKDMGRGKNAVLQYQQPVGPFQRRKPVRDCECRSVLNQPLQCLLDFCLRLRIHRRCRLVQYQYPRVLQDRTRNRYPLPLPSGKLVWVSVRASIIPK